MIDQRLAHFSTTTVFGKAWPTVNSLAAIAILLSVLATAVVSLRRVKVAIVLLLLPTLAYLVAMHPDPRCAAAHGSGDQRGLPS